MNFTPDERIEMYYKLSDYFFNQEEFKKLFDELLSSINTYKIINNSLYIDGTYFQSFTELYKYEDKLNEFYDKLNRVVQRAEINNPLPNIKQIIIYTIEALLEYEFFNATIIKLSIKNKDTYNRAKLKKELENNQHFYISDTPITIKLPIHENDIARNLYSSLSDDCKLDKTFIKPIIRIILPDVRKIYFYKETIKNYEELFKTFDYIQSNPLNKKTNQENRDKRKKRTALFKKNIFKKIRDT